MTPQIMVFVCNWANYTGTEQKVQPEELSFPDSENIKVCRVMCISRISRSLIFEALNAGVKGIIIIACKECHHKNARDIGKKRIEETIALIQNAGIAANKIKYVEVLPTDKLKPLIITVAKELGV